MRCESASSERSGFGIEELILFGKYRALSTLGSGSFGTVFLAEHLKLKTLRAVKRIPKDKLSRPSFSSEAGFPMEAELLKNLNHPGIPIIYDIDEDGRFVYIVEEYIQGESLDAFASRQKNISQELVLQLGIQLCDILDYLHHLAPYPILYQDFKPEHIILSGDQVKLIDFGIASFLTGNGAHIQQYGTCGFAAPEALAGRPTTPCADIYGLGKVLAFLAQGASPKCGRKTMRILSRATDQDPAARYQSAAEMKSALEDALQPRQPSHLIQRVAVIGSRPGAGATHLAVSLVCAQNRRRRRSLYVPSDGSDFFAAASGANPALTERDGVYHYGFFSGVPDYGEGVLAPLPVDACLVRDYGAADGALAGNLDADRYLLVLSGSDWDLDGSLSLAGHFLSMPQAEFICSHGDKTSARRLASRLGRRVFCFPEDPDPFCVTAEKDRLFEKLLGQKGGVRHFRF